MTGGGTVASLLIVEVRKKTIGIITTEGHGPLEILLAVIVNLFVLIEPSGITGTLPLPIEAVTPDDDGKEAFPGE